MDRLSTNSTIQQPEAIKVILADDNGDILLEKPVKLAVDDFSKGKYKLVESDDIGVIHDRRISHVDSMDLDED